MLVMFLICIFGFAGAQLLVFCMNGGKTQKELAKEREEFEQRLEESRKRSGPDRSENYVETKRLYNQAHPMICEILNRDKKQILGWIMDTKHIYNTVSRDMYRLSKIFDYDMPELKVNVPMIYQIGTKEYDLWLDRSKKEIEQEKKRLGISDIYDDPLALSDPYEPWDKFISRGKEIARKYGYFENGKPNIFKTKEDWWKQYKANENK